MINDILVYPDTSYGHMLAAIAAKYIKKKFAKHEIQYSPNVEVKSPSRLVLPFKDINKETIVWFLGDTPARGAMVDMKTENKPKKVLWWDYHISKIARVFEDEEAAGMDEYEGLRTENPCIGVQLWEYCFPKDPVPPCVRWVDDTLQGKGSMSARAFFYGLTLIETDPCQLATYPAVSDDMNNPADFWEAAFSVRIPIDLENPTRQYDDELANRMTWDATYQVMNMGSVIDTYLKLKTKWLLDHDWFSVYWITEKVPMILINSRDICLETIREWCRERYFNIPYGGYFYLENTKFDDWRIHIIRLHEGRDCIEYAKLHKDAWGNESTACFKTGILYNKLGLLGGKVHGNNADTRNPTTEQ